MEGFKIEVVKPEITFAKESKGVWESILDNVITQAVKEVVAPLKESNVDEEKMKAVRTAVEEEVRTLLKNNAEFVNANTISWAEDIANASEAALAEKMKARSLREILNEASGGNFVEMVSQNIK